ncbi:MAG: glycosyltransferase [Patescibacteria group bacterium]
MNNNPKVTILMPVYNGEQYLREAIESILNQTFMDFEFLIINDGSVDKSEKIIKLYENRRIIFANNPENKGLIFTLNRGLKMAQGKYVARMDQDDISLPERIKKQYDFLEKNSKIGLLGTAYYEINQKGDIIGKKIFPTTNKKLQKLLIKYNSFAHPSVIIRKDILNKIGTYSETNECLHIEDYDLWFRMARESEIANLSEPLLKRRYNGKNISIIKENEQIKNAFKLRKRVIKQGQYSKWNYICLLRPFFISKIPCCWLRFLRKYLLKSKIYD